MKKENGLVEIGCWNCAINGMKNGKPVCPDCGTEIAQFCKEYSHEKIWVKKPEQEPCEDAVSRKAVLDMATSTRQKVSSMTYGYCVYHERECDYKGNCVECPHNTVEDAEWFRRDEEQAEKNDIQSIIKTSI